MYYRQEMNEAWNEQYPPDFWRACWQENVRDFVVSLMSDSECLVFAQKLDFECSCMKFHKQRYKVQFEHKPMWIRRKQSSIWDKRNLIPSFQTSFLPFCQSPLVMELGFKRNQNGKWNNGLIALIKWTNNTKLDWVQEDIILIHQMKQNDNLTSQEINNVFGIASKCKVKFHHITNTTTENK